MEKTLDLATWNRKEHFYFFKDYTQPFFGMTAEVEITTAYRQAKESGSSFFLYYLHKALVAANQLAPFRYRITGPDTVTVYETVRAGATINRPDGSFSFSYLPYAASYPQFATEAGRIITDIRQTTGLPHTDRSQDVIYFSAIPWVRFTAIEHALNMQEPDSVPKIAFGKYTTRGAQMYMPVSVHVHHALMDGVHVGAYYDLLQTLLNEPSG